MLQAAQGAPSFAPMHLHAALPVSLLCLLSQATIRLTAELAEELCCGPHRGRQFSAECTCTARI